MDTSFPDLSDAERRFEWWRRTVGLFLGPTAFAIVLALPLGGLSVEAHRLAAIVSLVVAWWVTEAVPVAATALLGASLTVVLGVATAQDALAPFASPTIFLFLGSFILAEAIQAHGLDRRLALGLLRSGPLASSANRLRAATGLLAAGLSMWMSNTATAAMLLPVVLGTLGGVSAASPSPGRRDWTTGFLLVLAYSASIGGVATPVGTPPNLIALGMLDRLAGRDIDFFRWMALGVPLSAAMYGALMLLTRYLFGRGPTFAATARTDARPAAMGPLSRGEKNCLAAFAVAVALWITPGLAALAFGATSAPYRYLAARLDEGVVALLAALLLFVLPVDWKRRQFTVSWAQASKIDWGTILLFGGGLSLGRLMFTSGLAQKIGTGLVAASGAQSLWGITAVMCAVAILITEVTSNTAATSMLVPVALAVSEAAGVSPLPPALAIAFGASMAFMLPISTPPNAIVYGTGLVPVTAMLRCDLLLDAVSFVIILLGLRLLCPLLGLI